MTEPEWLSSTDPAPMLEFLKGKARDRNLILAAVAACRLRCAGEPHTLFGTEIEVCERYADRLATPAELYQLVNRFYAGEDSINPASTDRNTRDIRHAVTMLLDMIVVARRAPGSSLSTNAKLVFGSDRSLAPLVRDIFGNPFQAVTLDLTWLTSTVVSLAQQMYDSRDFSAMPILADALQDTGCDNPQVLEHCRGPGPHVRGCFVVDLCLNKS